MTTKEAFEIVLTLAKERLEQTESSNALKFLNPEFVNRVDKGLGEAITIVEDFKNNATYGNHEMDPADYLGADHS